jgi:hypothetical protein
VLKVAHLPAGPLPKDAPLDARYEVHRMAGETDFGPLQPLQYWIDLLHSGLRASEVRLLGLNGGPLSAFEFRLALALGAPVGILRDSGRAATTLLGDEDWQVACGLARLPADEQTARAFVQPGRRWALDDAARETMAQRTSKEHRQSRVNDLAKSDPALADWEHLRQDFKDSNLGQVDYIEEKLRAVGLKAQKVEPGRDPALMTFSAEETETMAEMEHGRWVAERLPAGWTLGPRDSQKKTSPFLVPWQDVPEDVKEWDRASVRRIPQMLKDVGYEVVRPRRLARGRRP